MVDSVPPAPDQQVRPSRVGLGAMASEPEAYLSQDPDQPYRFLVMGHVYGSFKPKTQGLFPPLERELQGEPGEFEFAVLTGDMVRVPDPPFFDALDDDLLALGIPAFVAPGNHDSHRGKAPRGQDIITTRYGARAKAWRRGPDAFVTCDTVVGGGNLTEADLASIRSIAEQGPLRSLFLFVHHVVWIDQSSVRSGKQKDLSNWIRTGYAERGTFRAKVLPLLEGLGVPVFVIAGDVGGGSPVTHSYEELGPNVHAITSGMGEHADVGTFLITEIDSRGVRFLVRYLAAPHQPPEGILPIPSRPFEFSQRQESAAPGK